MNAQSPLFAIEAKRLAAGISREQLASAAGMSLRHYDRLVIGDRGTPRASTLGKLRTALARLGRVQGAQDDMTRLVGSLFNAALALICQREGVEPSEVLRHAPSRRATADPAWLAAARLRQRAIALVNQGLDLPQSELARALGLTPAAISLAMGAVEDARHEDPELDRTMDVLERMLRGEG
ncbi:helix-turn-helix domain-containing protein [Aureimonas sp. AU12]|uniref:helix-turn-helix domain-containing protein n=1 Tax=Aureimonas sp. AU12 TaxID=1638161 RepID=UPI000782E705|nr:helix-turn-helix domain-containing protein [Aureimonas sp. AU12]